jgi:hypothetical protein
MREGEDKMPSEPSRADCVVYRTLVIHEPVY